MGKMDILFVILGMAAVIYCLIVTIFMGPISFAAVLAMGGLGLIAIGALPRVVKAPWADILCRRIALPLALLAMLAMAVSEGFVLAGMAQKDQSPADYIIVLGAGLRGDQVPLVLRSRLETALALEQGEMIVVSGGQGPHETVTEAAAMAKWLSERGIPADRILLEDASTSTIENLRFSARVIETQSGRPISDCKVKVISSDFHCTRAAMLARRVGYGEVSAAGGHTQALLVPVNHIRESMALIKSFLFDQRA